MINPAVNSTGRRAGTAPARRAAYEHLVIVTRQTELEELTARFNTAAQARFYLEHAGRDFTPIAQDHQQYHAVLDNLRGAIPRGIKSQIIDRQFLPQFSFGEDDLVVTIGPDGLVVNTAKYLAQQPILAINPDPNKIEGVLLPFTMDKAVTSLADTLAGQRRIQSITMANARLNDGQELLAFNDLFIGPKSHTSARYRLEQNGNAEDQSSSGIIVSTGAGSTGWLKSVYTGAVGIVEALGGEVRLPKDGGRFGWDEDYLIYTVREPWPSKTSQAKQIFGLITPDQPLKLTSYMAQHGVIFSDGIESDYLQFNAGFSATIAIADHKARLII
ncbi:MAG: sugar kinase [Gammaproteobacteria bacterium]|nr:sugar kinase [Gammaproteobacteria bacterium]MDH5652018.1 sugar kinase [Gammaproteobacteria bacterium]